MKSMKIVLAIIMLFIGGCAGIQNVTVIQKRPPYTGEVDVRIYPQASNGKLLFEIKFNSGKTGGLPDQDLMDELIAEGKKRGANVLIFDCASPGTVGSARCDMTGYYE